MKGKRKRERKREREREYWPRKNGSGPVSAISGETERGEEGRGEKRSSAGQVSHSIGRPTRFQIRFARPPRFPPRLLAGIN